MRINDRQSGMNPLARQCEHVLRLELRYEQRIQWLTEQLRVKNERIRAQDEQIRAQNERLLAQEKRLMAQCKQISMLIKQLMEELKNKRRQMYLLIERLSEQT